MNVARRIGRVLVGARGHAAAERVAVYEAFGIETVVVFDAADAEDAHLDEASWAAPLPEGAPRLAALVGVAMDAGADALDPSGTDLAASEEAARLATSVGLAWLGARAELLAGERAVLSDASLELPSAEVTAVTVLGDGAGGVVVVGAARVRKDVALVGDLAPEVEARLFAAARSAALALRVHGAATAWFSVDDEGTGVIFGWNYGLPEHHALLAVGNLSLAAAAVRLHAGENLGLTPSVAGLVQVPGVRVVVRARVAGEVPALEAGWVRAAGEACAPGDVIAVVRAEGATPAAACVRGVAALHALAEPSLHDARRCADVLAAWSASGAQRATLGET